MFVTLVIKAQISNLMRTTRFWNNNTTDDLADDTIGDLQFTSRGIDPVIVT